MEKYILTNMKMLNQKLEEIGGIIRLLEIIDQNQPDLTKRLFERLLTYDCLHLASFLDLTLRTLATHSFSKTYAFLTA